MQGAAAAALGRAGAVLWLDSAEPDSVLLRKLHYASVNQALRTWCVWGRCMSRLSQHQLGLSMIKGTMKTVLNQACCRACLRCFLCVQCLVPMRAEAGLGSEEQATASLAGRLTWQWCGAPADPGYVLAFKSSALEQVSCSPPLSVHSGQLVVILPA